MAVQNISDGIIALIRKAETQLPQDVIKALHEAYQREKGIAKIQLETILKNIDMAQAHGKPLCQDTGTQTFFVRIGVKSPHITKIEAIIKKGVKSATSQIPLRPNTVDPFTGINHGDNLGDHMPHIIWDLCKGDKIRITAFPKGAGSENMSKLQMFTPTVSWETIEDFVVNTVIEAGGKPCPPTIVGVGIGGGADVALKNAKLALLRPVGSQHTDKQIASFETTIKKRVNKSGIGPMGLGGKTTTLAVHLEKAHRHPASLPVGIVLQCWANRRATMTIFPDGSWRGD